MYNLNGLKIETLKKGLFEAGRHYVVWNIQSMSSGIYFARLQTGGQVQTLKMQLLI